LVIPALYAKAIKLVWGHQDSVRGNVRVEKRLDGSLAARFADWYLPIQECAMPAKAKPAATPKVTKTGGKRQPGERWDNHQIFRRKGPKVWQAAEATGYRREAQ
jgi:hypothetical protein